MRFSPSLLLAAITTLWISPLATTAQETPTYSERMSARRDLELAKMELRHYWQIEYPRQQRRLNAAIELTEEEIRSYREQLKAYGPFNRFSWSQPMLVTVQEVRMCLRDAELRLQDLWAERNALTRFHSDQWRVLEIKVHEARLRVAELEAALDAEEEAAEEREEPLAQQWPTLTR